jgi:hypothetical protein
MNEPRDGDAPCDAAFYNFFSDMTSAIRGWDPNHLINSGTGTIYDPGFNCGTSPDTYHDIYSLPNNNFAEFHDYNEPLSLPPEVQSAIATANAIGKPIIGGEMGITGGSTRPAQYDGKFSSAFGAGVAGYIPWEYQNIPSNRIKYAFGPTDSVIPIIARYCCGC